MTYSQLAIGSVIGIREVLMICM